MSESHYENTGVMHVVCKCPKCVAEQQKQELATWCSQCGRCRTHEDNPLHAGAAALKPEFQLHRYEGDARDDCHICGEGAEHELHDHPLQKAEKQNIGYVTSDGHFYWPDEKYKADAYCLGTSRYYQSVYAATPQAKEQKQEPVMWAVADPDEHNYETFTDKDEAESAAFDSGTVAIPLYAAPPQDAQDGMVMVPRETTDAMQHAGVKAAQSKVNNEQPWGEYVYRIYRAMLDATMSKEQKK